MSTIVDETILVMEGISVRFGGTLALDGVDFSLREGEVHALVGENGSGKSTLMRVLAGVVQPVAGSVVLNHQPFSPANPHAAKLRGVEIVHQELSICPHLSVLENLVLGNEAVANGLLSRKRNQQTAERALEFLGLPDLDLDASAGQLPIGIRQLLEIGRAASTDAGIVILDEPTSSLTEADVRRLFKVIESLKRRGTAVVFISHFLNEVREIADRVTILRDGRYVGTSEVNGITDEGMISMMVGRPIADLYPRSKRVPGEVIIEVAGLRSSPLPKEASLQLKRGEVVGIAGLNGSGRSELLRAIFGLQEVVDGTVRIGDLTGPFTPAECWSHQMGMLSEDRKDEGLAINLSIAENLTLASLPPGLISPTTLRSASEKWILTLNIRCQGPDQAIGELSGGNQQKVAIARMLFHEVDVFLLDEPTRGIDVGSKEQIYRLIDQLATDGKSVLMVSSYLPELIGICDRIGVMTAGKLGPFEPAEDWTQESILQQALAIQ